VRATFLFAREEGGRNRTAVLLSNLRPPSARDEGGRNRTAVLLSNLRPPSARDEGGFQSDSSVVVQFAATLCTRRGWFQSDSSTAVRAWGVNLLLMVARGKLICFLIGFAHCPRAFGSPARAVGSITILCRYSRPGSPPHVLLILRRIRSNRSSFSLKGDNVFFCLPEGRFVPLRRKRSEDFS